MHAILSYNHFFQKLVEFLFVLSLLKSLHFNLSFYNYTVYSCFLKCCCDLQKGSSLVVFYSLQWIEVVPAFFQ